MPILTPHLGGWRSPDGYSFSIGGSWSRRLRGVLVTPQGACVVLVGAKRHTQADLLGRAEREICAQRAGGTI